MKDDDYLRSLYDKEEYALYQKVCDEVWPPLPVEYKKNGKKRRAYKERQRAPSD